MLTSLKFQTLRSLRSFAAIPNNIFNSSIPIKSPSASLSDLCASAVKKPQLPTLIPT